jgi:AraC family transcriptional regulator
MPRSKLKRTIDFINSNLERDITLNDIAAEADLSAYHFSRLFKQSTGVPPHRYLLQARIEKAKSLLKNQQDSIAEISHKLGFSDQSHFTMFFKRFTGYTPRSFREKL